MSDSDESQPSKFRVLIADDASMMRRMVRLALESHGRLELVGEAEDGAQAITLAEELRPDIILLDLTMPVMDGFEAIPELRARVPAARILAFSAVGGDALNHAVSLGADDCLEKGDLVKLNRMLVKLGEAGPRRDPALELLTELTEDFWDRR
jgi:two-component system, chemotaxis family, chemotaxis protein CheY